MKTLLKFLKATLIGGVFFLLPLAFAGFILQKTLHFIAKIIAPLAESIPFQSPAGLDTPYILAAIVMLIACFAAGLVANTWLGSGLKSWLERTLLRFIPGYSLLESIGEQSQMAGTNSRISTALVGGQGRWELCFIVERHANGYVTVFKPSAPTPKSGAVIIAAPEQVKELNVPVAAAIKCLMQDGGGSAELLKDSLKT